ncbi:MAG TPA: hypothetical protein VJL31_12945 [Gemmatimonadales bacterium]|nr:hypothetical protein [Gemmatimonadales bacterium]
MYHLGAIPLLDQNLPLEATEAMTRVQERERVFVAAVAAVLGVLATLAFLRRG